MGKGERKYGDRKDVISPLMATQDFLEGVGGTCKGIELGKSGEMEFSVITELWDWLELCWAVWGGWQNRGQLKGWLRLWEGMCCITGDRLETGPEKSEHLEAKYSFPGQGEINLTLSFESRNWIGNNRNKKTNQNFSFRHSHVESFYFKTTKFNVENIYITMFNIWVM